MWDRESKVLRLANSRACLDGLLASSLASSLPANLDASHAHVQAVKSHLCMPLVDVHVKVMDQQVVVLHVRKKSTIA